MYHELLMALQGVTGDVFKFDGKFIRISKDLQVPLFHPSEHCVVEGILEVASYYKRLEAFIDSQFELDNESSLNQTKGLCSSNSQTKQRAVGLYLSACCNGIRDIVEHYKQEMSSLELDLMENPYMTVTEIRAKTEPFRAVFQALDLMVAKVQTQSQSSVLIVECLKTEYDLNVHLQSILKRLIPWVNQVLYNQIVNWTVFGSLHDPYGEFFIKQQLVNLLPKSGGTGSANTSMNTSKLDSTLTGGSKSLHHKYGSRGVKDKVNEKYYVDYAVVPSHFPIPLTDRILYIGSSIGVLSNSEKTRGSITVKQQHFYDKLKQISIDTFRIEELSAALGDIAFEVGKDLHHLVVAETDLPKHLGIVKDFFLTGRGELFHDFLLNLKSFSMTKSSLLSEVRQAFMLAATRVQVQDDILQRININISKDIPPKPNLAFVMSAMSLEMEDEWPLHILFSQEALEKYNELFRFLLQVRLLQIELNRIWLDTRHVFRFPIPQGPAELRIVMSYFIDHLQHYLQEDVLENQYAILVNAVDKSENFDQILLAHVHFQSNILAQAFRNSKQLKHFLDEILKVCNNYVRFITNHIQVCEAKDLPINEGISKEIVEFSVDFRRHMDLLLNLLKNMALNPQSGQYLGQFLLRLDFNSYFSKIITGFNV